LGGLYMRLLGEELEREGGGRGGDCAAVNWDDCADIL
jgi:hypothetical protein